MAVEKVEELEEQEVPVAVVAEIVVLLDLEILLL